MSFFSSCNKIVTERKKIKWSIYANGYDEIGWNSPDWSNAQDISANLSTTDYTLLDDGWVVGAYYAYGGNADIYFQINGISVACSGNMTNYGWFGQFQAKVSKGDKVKFS